VTPHLSIVVPTWNRRPTLEHVLPTLVRQTAGTASYEVLLCDGGSDDGTDELVAAIGAPNVRLIPHAGDTRARARNTGIRLASGGIVLFTDADILADARLVEVHLEAHARHPRLAIVGWEAPVDSLAEYEAALADPARRRRLHPTWRRRLSWEFFVTGNASARREDLERVGGFDERFTQYGHEDLELGYRLQRAGVRLRYNPRAVGYHWHPQTREQRLIKMEASGRATVRCYRKHHDASTLWRMGVNPASWLLHGLLRRAPRALARLEAAAARSAAARAVLTQYVYMSGVRRAWRDEKETVS
jgi:GT2 family glycosyltransferase